MDGTVPEAEALTQAANATPASVADDDFQANLDLNEALADLDEREEGALEAVFPDSALRHVSLSFSRVSYKLMKGRGSKREVAKTILQPMSGYINKGTFVAIMGPSGSGKTSLLNVLAGRVGKQSNAVLSGEVLVNGTPRGSDFRKISAYVMQDDLLFSCLTVYETLWFAAKLRLPSTISLDQKKAITEAVIAELGLAKARDTCIGNEMMRGVSGGERKRVSIGVEMLANPSLVFLDEPTSGLDSFQALNVISALAGLVRRGRTVISTIHQPRSAIFALFQDLILLSEGKMIYFGRAAEAVGYFSRLGLLCPEHYNPADYFLDAIALDKRNEKREKLSSRRLELLSSKFKLEDSVRPELHQKSMEEEALALGQTKSGPQYSTGWFTQFHTLALRTFWQVSRDKLPIFIGFGQTVVMSVIISILYSGNTSPSVFVQNIQGAIFFIAVSLAFNGIFQVLSSFPVERGTVNRERAANTYRISAYYPAKVAVEWLFLILPTILLVVITYWPVQFYRTADRFFIFLLLAVLEFSSMNAIGLWVGAFSPNPQIAQAFGPLITVLFMLFAGFYVNLNTIPVWIRWVRYLSPIQWAFIGMSINQFQGLTIPCSQEEIQQGCVTSGDQVLANLGVTEYTEATAIACQCALIVGYHALAFITLQFNGPKLQDLSKAGKDGLEGEVTKEKAPELMV